VRVLRAPRDFTSRQVRLAATWTRVRRRACRPGRPGPAGQAATPRRRDGAVTVTAARLPEVHAGPLHAVHGIAGHAHAQRRPAAAGRERTRAALKQWRRLLLLRAASDEHAGPLSAGPLQGQCQPARSTWPHHPSPP
jgi:hypothetical protein